MQSTSLPGMWLRYNGGTKLESLKDMDIISNPNTIYYNIWKMNLTLAT